MLKMFEAHSITEIEAVHNETTPTGVRQVREIFMREI
jgi:hypothetical protein